ncbi:hypothetical protein QR98_0071720 [Sarcoptes scabiei]|uniref:Uncharacterized protein n=1 Tax=Sarcoptes scabiei TaxID=52283 RepID=A0A132ACQ3_SARSC|nr:hypothetical protein QR98_0071720 [Sarcoptes scabiei]
MREGLRKNCSESFLNDEVELFEAIVLFDVVVIIEEFGIREEDEELFAKELFVPTPEDDIKDEEEEEEIDIDPILAERFEIGSFETIKMNFKFEGVL